MRRGMEWHVSLLIRSAGQSQTRHGRHDRQQRARFSPLSSIAAPSRFGCVAGYVDGSRPSWETPRKERDNRLRRRLTTDSIGSCCMAYSTGGTANAARISAAVMTSALGMIRTCNLLIRSQMLYPLSYERLCRQCTGCLPLPCRVIWSCCYALAEKEGFEPSDQVSPIPSLAVRSIRPLSHFSNPERTREKEVWHNKTARRARFLRSCRHGP